MYRWPEFSTLVDQSELMTNSSTPLNTGILSDDDDDDEDIDDEGEGDGDVGAGKGGGVSQRGKDGVRRNIVLPNSNAKVEVNSYDGFKSRKENAVDKMTEIISFEKDDSFLSFSKENKYEEDSIEDEDDEEESTEERHSLMNREIFKKSNNQGKSIQNTLHV